MKSTTFLDDQKHLDKILRNESTRRYIIKCFHRLFGIKNLSTEQMEDYILNFLFFMACHGYILRKTKIKLDRDYYNIDETIQEAKDEETRLLKQLLKFKEVLENVKEKQINEQSKNNDQ